MQANPVKRALLLISIALLLSLAACASKSIINGRVVDAETGQPIKDAAVAIRWLENQSEDNSSTVHMFDAAQDLSDKDGNFSIPEYQNRKYVMGVYKEGYICWSSRSDFSSGTPEKTSLRFPPNVENGMEIHLAPLTEGYSRDKHAGFAVLVASEVAESKKDPFYKAIMPLFRQWRDNLRKEFQKKMGHKKTEEPH
ncbi:MAG: carboxypeptidase-like regulatory domain-containing protein [Desulfobacterales bacterium]